MKTAYLSCAILCVCLVSLSLISTVNSQGSNTLVKVVPAQKTVNQGDTFTLDVTVSNVQNLFGLDLTVSWNSAILKIITVDDRLGVDLNPDGVLYTSSGYGIEVASNVTNQNTGQHEIVATSQADANSFNGTGTVCKLTFQAVAAGHSDITVQSTLADRPFPDEVSEEIAHTDMGGSVDVTVLGTSSSPTSTGSVEPSASIPEISVNIALIALALTFATAVAVTCVTRRKRAP